MWGTCVEYNPKYLYVSRSLAQDDSIKAVESPAWCLNVYLSDFWMTIVDQSKCDGSSWETEYV